jgi:signal peptidase I
MPKNAKGPIREWFDALVFAVIAASLIRWATFEAFTIPTPSMETTLQVGDFLFVNKLNYGPRTPMTPLQVPLTHQKIWGTNIPSYLEWIKLPQIRFPGFSEIERNDVVVFNYPRELDKPIDLKTYYVKRCVALPGDVLEISDGKLIINSDTSNLPIEMQYRFYVRTDQTINPRIFKKYNIWEYSKTQGGYFINTKKSIAEKLKNEPFIQDLVSGKMEKYQNSFSIFPDGNKLTWNTDFYGPLTIPKKDMKIKINEENILKYGSTIVDYEHHNNIQIEGDKLYIDDIEVKEYKFIQNYYFMMGDNRHNSEDSRFWGFVPEDHVLGEASFIWLSIDNKESFFKKIRWNRLFKVIK